MNWMQVVGVLLMATPFVVLAAYMIRESGVLVATAILGLTAAVGGVILLGSYLATGGK